MDSSSDVNNPLLCIPEPKLQLSIEVLASCTKTPGKVLQVGVHLRCIGQAISYARQSRFDSRVHHTNRRSIIESSDFPIFPWPSIAGSVANLSKSEFGHDFANVASKVLESQQDREREHVRFLCELIGDEDLGPDVTNAARQVRLAFQPLIQLL